MTYSQYDLKFVLIKINEIKCLRTQSFYSTIFIVLNLTQGLMTMMHSHIFCVIIII